MTAGGEGPSELKALGRGVAGGSRVWLARVARRFFADSRVNAPPLRMTALGQGSRGWRAEHGFAGV